MGEEQNQELHKKNGGASLRATRATVTLKDKGKFAAGLSFKKLFFIFLICSVLGAIYEDVLIYIKTWWATGTGEWMLHRGVIYGPFNVIYGFGGALMCWLLLRKKYSDLQVFGIAALVGGVVEYGLSLLQEIFTGTTSWNYDDYFLNIGGRTTIPFMLFWGLLGLAVVKVVYPILSKLIESIPMRIGNPLFWLLLVFMIINCLVSWTAIIRQTFRQNNMPPLTPIGEFYDEYYTDEYLRRYFPNMVRSGGKDA